MVRVRAGQGDPCRPAPGRPPDRLHPRQPGWPGRAGRGALGRARPAGRAPRRCRRRDPAPGRRIRRAGRLHPPRRRPGRARAGRPRSRAPGHRGPRTAHVQGSRDLRARRDPDRLAHALRRLHTLQERLAEGAARASRGAGRLRQRRRRHGAGRGAAQPVARRGRRSRARRVRLLGAGRGAAGRPGPAPRHARRRRVARRVPRPHGRLRRHP